MLGKQLATFVKNFIKLDNCKIYYWILLNTKLEVVAIKNDCLVTVKKEVVVFSHMTPFSFQVTILSKTKLNNLINGLKIVSLMTYILVINLTRGFQINAGGFIQLQILRKYKVLH